MPGDEVQFVPGEGVHQPLGRLHDAVPEPRFHGRGMHRDADARPCRQAFRIGGGPAQLHCVDLLLVFLRAVVNDVVEYDIVRAPHVEGIIGGAEMAAVVLRRLAVGVFVQVVVVVADHAVYGYPEPGELRFHACEEFRGVPYDVPEHDRGLVRAPRPPVIGCRLQCGHDLAPQPPEMLFGLGLRIGDRQQFVAFARAGPRLQFEVVAFGRRVVCAVELRDAPIERSQVAGRGHQTDEQRLVVGIEREYALLVALRERITVGYGHAAHRLSAAFDRSPYRAGCGCGAEAAGQQEK